MDDQNSDKPFVKLSGQDGNAFMVIGLCMKAAKKAGWNKTMQDNVRNEMMSGDYNNLLQVALKYFEVR